MHNQNCGCQCAPCLESISASVAGGVMQIAVIPLQAYYDYKFYGFDLCLSLPAHIGTEPVSIFDGTNIYAVLDSNGQPVVSGRLRGHKRYRVRFGAGGDSSLGPIPPHFTVYDGLCCMEYSANAALQAPGQGG